MAANKARGYARRYDRVYHILSRSGMFWARIRSKTRRPAACPRAVRSLKNAERPSILNGGLKSDPAQWKTAPICYHLIPEFEKNRSVTM